MTYDEIVAKKQRNDEFSKWREEQADKMPELAARVFALRSKGYMGCGFHWSLECTLGTVMSRLNDYDSPKYYHGDDAIAYQVALEVMTEGLYEQVEEAEATSQWWVGTSADAQNPGIIYGPFDERPPLQTGHFLYKRAYLKLREGRHLPEWFCYGGEASDE